VRFISGTDGHIRQICTVHGLSDCERLAVHNGGSARVYEVS
jgi:hypothetical protein